MWKIGYRRHSDWKDRMGLVIKGIKTAKNKQIAPDSVLFPRKEPW